MTDQRRDPGAGTCHGTPRGIYHVAWKNPSRVNGSAEDSGRAGGSRRQVVTPRTHALARRQRFSGRRVSRVQDAGQTGFSPNFSNIVSARHSHLSRPPLC